MLELKLKSKKKGKTKDILLIEEESEEKKKAKKLKEVEKVEPKKSIKVLKVEFVKELSIKIEVKRFKKLTFETPRKYKELTLPFVEKEKIVPKIVVERSKPVAFEKLKEFKELKLEFRKFGITVSLEKFSSPSFEAMKTYKELKLPFEKDLAKNFLVKVEVERSASSFPFGDLLGGGGGMEEEKFPIKAINFGRGFSRGTGSPRVIITNLPMIYSYLATEVYREIMGEYPKVEMRVVSSEGKSIDEFSLTRNGNENENGNKEELFTRLHSVELGGKVEIFLIKEKENKRMKCLKNLLRLIKERIEKSSLEKLGFLIIGIHSTELREEEIKKAILEVEESAFMKREEAQQKIEKTYLIKLESRIDPEREDGKFITLNKERMRILNQLKEKYSVFVKRNKVEQEEVGDVEQYPFKVAVVKCCLDRIKKKENESEEDFLIRVFEKEKIIETEREINTKDGKVIIPDIITEKEYIEIETLISTFEPLKKLDETVEKYKEVKDKDLILVVKPEVAVLYLTQLKKREQIYEKIYSRKIPIKLICFENGQPTLCSLQEFESKIKGYGLNSSYSLVNIVSGVFYKEQKK